MKIMTNRAFREEIEKMLYEENERRWNRERFERLEEDLRKLGWRVEALEGKRNAANAEQAMTVRCE
jgi:hypothetical protein